MEPLFTDYLFSKGYFVGGSPQPPADAAAAVGALAKLFNIDVVSGAEYASPAMIRVASRCLGENVPEPFYRGFPASVKSLTPEALFWDQFIHYAVTYGLGRFAAPGHSLIEGEARRTLFSEDAPVKRYCVISAAEGERYLQNAADALFAGSRSVSDAQYALLRGMIDVYGYRPRECACKDTAVRLLLDTRSTEFAAFLKLSDVIRLAQTLQARDYGSEDLSRLQLKNRDRRLLTAVIDLCFAEDRADVSACYEKRRAWCGLLHMLHYKPKTPAAAAFAAAIRNKTGRSAYAGFEALVAAGDPRGAAAYLIKEKGAGALLRHLNYLLSRCRTAQEAADVAALIGSRNQILLIQLLLRYGTELPAGARTFVFSRFGLLRVHTETAGERKRRRSTVPEPYVARAADVLRNMLREACSGKLGRVYADEGMKKIALPLQENASFGGVGVLPKGSRVKLPDGKKLRAFTYWEQVDDIDLSAFGLSETGAQIEFSWRNMCGAQSEAIAYSGDETSGALGGSEYFDLDLPLFRAAYPDCRYVLFCNNVFTGVPFAECVCRAGYMVRDTEDSGEVFEPKTVDSAFRVNCDSTFAYLFALDLHTRELVWLNLARQGAQTVAGDTDTAFLLRYMRITEIVNVYDYARLLAGTFADDPARADVVFSDRQLTLPAGVKQIRSCDYEQFAALLAL